MVFTKKSLKISSDSRQEQVTGYEGKKQRWPWLNLEACVWSGFLMTLLIVCSHASRMSLVPLTQEKEGDSVSFPTGPKPALMPVLTVKFWGQTKTAPLSPHSYTVVYQEWFPPQQSEIDAERPWTLSKTELAITLHSALLSFKMHEKVCRCPANTPTLRERARTAAYMMHPLAHAVNAP